MFNKIRLVGLTFALMLFLYGCDRLFFYPTYRVVATPNVVGLTYKDIYLSATTDIALHGWHLPAIGERRGTILFFHGNGENISTHFASVYWLPKHGFEVFLFDYRGYGLSEGVPEVETSIKDAELQIEFLQQKYGVDSRKLVIFGQSFGGAVAINAVARSNPPQTFAALVVDSSFSGFRRIAREKLGDVWLTWPLQWPLSLAFTGEFDSVDAIRDIHLTPVLVVHSKTDEIIPFKHGEKLFQAANEPKQFWPLEDARHIASMTRKDVREKFLQYLESVLPKEPDNASKAVK